MNFLDTPIQLPSNNKKNLNEYIRFIKKTQLTHILFPNMEPSIHFSDKFYLCNNNTHLTILIIQKMSLGIIMTDHTANQFGYIKCILEKGQHTIVSGSKLKIVTIDEQWDIHQWNPFKINRFYYDMSDYMQRHRSIASLQEYIQEHEWVKDKVDIAFLETLSWGD